MYSNRVCVKINCYKGFSYEETLNGIKNAGFKYIELSVSKGNSIGLTQDISDDELLNIKKDINERGLVPVAIGGGSFLMDEDTSKIIRNIELAHLLDCKYVDTTVFNAHNETLQKSQDEKVISKIQTFIPYLEKYNLDLVLELHGSFATGKSLRSIVKSVNNKHIHINYDSGNALFWGGLEVDEMLKDFKDNVELVSYMHLKDKLDKKNVWNFPALGKGYIPFKDILNILNDNNNDATLCVEIEFTENGVKDVEEVDKALLDSATHLKQLGLNLNK